MVEHGEQLLKDWQHPNPIICEHKVFAAVRRAAVVHRQGQPLFALERRVHVSECSYLTNCQQV